MIAAATRSFYVFRSSDEEPGGVGRTPTGTHVETERSIGECSTPDLLQIDELWKASWGPVLYEVAYPGRLDEEAEPIVRRVERWNESMLRLIACTYAERALSHLRRMTVLADLTGAVAPSIERTIEAARRYALGEMSPQTMAASRAALERRCRTLDSETACRGRRLGAVWLRSIVQQAMGAAILAASQDSETDEFGTFLRKAAALMAAAMSPPTATRVSASRPGAAWQEQIFLTHLGLVL